MSKDAVTIFGYSGAFWTRAKARKGKDNGTDAEGERTMSQFRLGVDL